MFNFMAQLMNKKLRSQQLDRKTEIPWIWYWLVDPLLWSVKVKVAQAFPTPFDPMDYTVHGNLQARILEWVAIPFSRESSQPRDWTQVSWIAGGFFTIWATREAPSRLSIR